MTGKILKKSTEIDREAFAEIKAAQAEGVEGFDCANEMNLLAEEVLIAYKHTDFTDFRKEILNSIADTIDEGEKPARITEANTAYYRGLLAKKGVEGKNLKQARDYLMEQVTFLRKAVVFLETRKQELEAGIKGLEKNVSVGIDFMEELEDLKRLK
jgi:hypothetical protein